ncbi:exosome complex exonuclease RRP44-like [Limulus polyphemus]|uniref:Exosome complex exonuclease RRP44-like n=1 Tax=Limulus polyphemus TaxID=6850 RepID=A0ABM1BIN7_LIMPO|nr:exosome complex exonuclease RRP44-like [Limulus polyphemus]
MITSKTFLKKTRRGSVLKVVREHYLRDDIWCGSSSCVQCSDPNPSLEKQPKSFSTLYTEPHYLIPDTNVVLHQMDVLEDPVFQNVIILQTVLQEVRHRHSPIYGRIKEVLTNKERHFHSFTNEHHKLV